MQNNNNYEMHQISNYLDDISSILKTLDESTLALKNRTAEMYTEFRERQYDESVKAVNHFVKDAVDENNEYIMMDRS